MDKGHSPKVGCRWQVEKARAEFDPEAAEERRQDAAEDRHVTTHLGFMTSEGVVPITAMADVADAVTFEEYISSEAAKLDPAIQLQIRRSMVLGMLGKSDAQRQVTIYAHLRLDQVMVDVDNTRSVITPEHLQEWCQAAGAKVTVRPVIDLAEELCTEAYEPTEEMKEQVRLRYRECVFPYCHRLSRDCDLDHIITWPLGPTATWNLAPLCRGHHRLKTHTPGPTGGCPAPDSCGPTPKAGDMSTDHHPADHGRRGSRCAVRPQSETGGQPRAARARA